MSLSNNPHKIVLLGESGVGKTSLALRFCEGEGFNNPEPTIAVAFHSKAIYVGDKAIKVQIWDTAGQEIYRSLTPMYIRNAAAAIIVYDITNEESFGKLESWIDEMVTLAATDVVIAIVGNKSDLEKTRDVDTQEGEEFAAQNNFIFQETSARTGFGVNQVFTQIATRLIAKEKKKQVSLIIPEDTEIEDLQQKKKKCC
ncbi:ras-related protein rab-5c [Anaeramoeba ignava]|uniref:Ras-related protein rab-5c n=1 Tax=Anaeramoeba ignava TaxID=1746090 RepID=A0A9Q0R4B1_ANAIG|nr:ras-related protein rab-5c [Anaeramoeba ignava]